MKKKSQKNLIHRQLHAFERFNEWEQQLSVKPTGPACLKAVFELYDLIPDQARQRPSNVEGIVKMREALACLT